jgi:transposase
MRRDTSTYVQGYTAESYVEALQFALPKIWNPSRILQHDNAKIHTAKKTQKFLKRFNIRWIQDWPPYSPDLNPIEHFWGLLKQRVLELYPDIELWFGPNESVIERMEDALVHAWDTLDSEIVHNCVESMQKRCRAVVESRGWYTRY